MIFTPDEQFKDEDFTESVYKDALQSLVYTSDNIAENYTITDMSFKQYDAVDLANHMQEFAKNYNFSLIAPIKTENFTINVTKVFLQGNDTGER